jgi:phenylalanyl-tRNA synthetase beta chain
MPKIDVDQELFFSLLGRRYGPEELETLLPAAKAELDEWPHNPGPDGRLVMKIELNDTNRPDLWSTCGLARQLRIHSGGAIPAYSFFSREGDIRDAGGLRVEVDPSVRDVRPYIAAFVISGKPINEPMLKDIIQTQEKLCWNFGRKRKSIAMGVYRSAKMRFPVRYAAVDPRTTSFVPLGFDREMSLERILAEHPKGQEFGSILAGLARYPYLSDAKGETLSFPPIINSASLGAVEPGDSELFVELTGSDMPSLCVAASIVACDFADSGYAIKPVRVDYPYDTPFGRSVTFPYYFQKPVSCGLDRMSRILGRSISGEEAQAALARMGCRTDRHGQYIQVFPPEYRNDFLHAADVIEDVAMGAGLASFPPERPSDFTIGRLTPIEAFTRRAKDILVGQGFQEMIFNYLGSGADYLGRMRLGAESILRIANPMSESFEYIRNSTLPGLMGTEASSGGAAYPHRIFEAGKVVLPAPGENYGCVTRQYLGFLTAHAEADFNEAAAILNALLFYLRVDYSLEASEDPRFIPGRQARVLADGESLGIFGEIHPEVIEAWGVSMPCAGGELDLEAAMGALARS